MIENLLFPYPSKKRVEDWEFGMTKEVIELPFGKERIVYVQRIKEAKLLVSEDPDEFREGVEYWADVHGYRVNPQGFLRVLKSPRVREIPYTRFNNKECREVVDIVRQEVERHAEKHYPGKTLSWNGPIIISRGFTLPSGRVRIFPK